MVVVIRLIVSGGMGTRSTVGYSMTRYRPLPYLGIANRFYRCRDCYAVWVAGSLFERVAEDRVCGVYDHTLKWKPYP